MNKRKRYANRDTAEEIQAKLSRYLEAHVANGGRFVKSKYIARELGLSSKMVGSNLLVLSSTSDKFHITPWGVSSCFTWSVTLKDTVQKSST